MDEQTTARPRLSYQPALDGVRALAVAIVLLFHAGVPGFDGGYLGVSVFFTLSGFLITSLLIGEHARTGTVAAGAFYARRARRLLPASTLCLVVVAALGIWGPFDQVPHLRRDLAGAALQVYNWVKLAGGGSYTDLFASTGALASPLEHYWSLAIEEQFYWFWPLAFVGLATLARRRGWSLLATIGVPTVAAIAAGPIVAGVWGPDAAYWATPARIGEMLTGAFAAALVAAGRNPRWTRAAAPWCLAMIAVACVTFPSASGPAYRGLLPALSTVTAVLLLGLQSGGPLRTVLSVRPLVAIGTISYGIYLFHWPIFVLFDEQRVGHGGIVLLAVRLGLTGGAAIVSYLVVEQPIRRASLPTRPTLVGGFAVSASIVAIAVLMPATGIQIDTAGDAAPAAAIDPSTPRTPLTPADPSAASTSPPTAASWRSTELEAPTPSRPVRVLVAGDSTAKAVGGGLVRWAAANPDLMQVSIEAAPGCGFVQGGVRVFPEGDQEIGASCADYVDSVLPRAVAELQPDVVLMMTTAWDVIDQRFPGTEAESPVDPTYQDRIAEDFSSVTERVLDAGAPLVVWIAEPIVDPYWNPVASPQQDPARHGVLHDSMRAIAADQPDQVAVADLAWWFTASGLDEDRSFRPDGVHVTAEASEQLAETWLGPLLIQAALG